MKKIFFAITLSIAATQMYGQKRVVNFFPAAAVPSGGNTNVQELVKGYINPVTQDFGSLINNGWYNTAATHKKFGFDLTVTLNALSAKSEDERFIVPALSGVQFDGTTSLTDKPATAYGPQKDFPKFHYTAGPNNGKAFDGPDGAGINKDVPIGSIAVPTIQAGIGLFANTDLRIRYTPKTTIADNALENWGVGIHHDIKQHIPGLKELPFSLSVFVAYSQLKATTDLSGVYTGSAVQQGAGKTNAYTIQAMISKKLSIFTFYGAVGYNTSKTDYKIKGTFLVDHATSNGSNVSLTPVTLTDPFSLTTKVNGLRATGGLRLNFGPVILNGDYSFVNSKGIYTMGFGFTVR